jgi:lipooligosaccharide transport system permease protein
VIWALGLYDNFAMTLALLPVALLTGFCFAGMGLAINAVSPNYDFFLYYFTLAITPMILLGGVFYPPSALPAWLADIAAWLPLTHAIELARPLVLGRIPADLVLHGLALIVYGIAGFTAALVLTQRRLLK